jgi:hypothetical protein
MELDKIRLGSGIGGEEWKEEDDLPESDLH